MSRISTGMSRVFALLILWVLRAREKAANSCVTSIVLVSSPPTEHETMVFGTARRPDSEFGNDNKKTCRVPILPGEGGTLRRSKASWSR